MSKICSECDAPAVKHGFCQSCLEDATCPGCDAVEGTPEWGTVGDGFDGYCPSCADEREEDGTVELG
jgi:hypothetical protein